MLARTARDHLLGKPDIFHTIQESQQDSYQKLLQVDSSLKYQHRVLKEMLGALVLIFFQYIPKTRDATTAASAQGRFDQYLETVIRHLREQSSVLNMPSESEPAISNAPPEPEYSMQEEMALLSDEMPEESYQDYV